MARNAKSELVQRLQKRLGRPLAKGDAVYASEKHFELFQTVLSLPCCDLGEEYIGELCATQKEAEQSAASQALQRLEEEEAPVAAEASKKKVAAQPAVINRKSQLVQAVQRQQGRTMAKGDIVYSTEKVDEEFRSTVRLVCMAGEEFTGKACETEKLAEHAAAEQALLFCDALMEDPEAAIVPKKSAAPLAGNRKSELTQALQKQLRRTMAKGDVVYSTEKIGAEFQSTVRLVCMAGEEFTGEVSETAKLAEHSAAQQALSHSESLLNQEAAPAPAKKAAAAAEESTGEVSETKKLAEHSAAALHSETLLNQEAAPAPAKKAAASAEGNPKSELITYLQKLLRRTLTKADVVYEVEQTEGGLQATVHLPCLEERAFAGEEEATAKRAEAAAARQALLWLPQDFGEPAPAAKRRKTA